MMDSRNGIWILQLAEFLRGPSYWPGVVTGGPGLVTHSQYSHPAHVTSTRGDTDREQWNVHLHWDDVPLLVRHGVLCVGVLAHHAVQAAVGHLGVAGAREIHREHLQHSSCGVSSGYLLLMSETLKSENIRPLLWWGDNFWLKSIMTIGFHLIQKMISPLRVPGPWTPRDRASQPWHWLLPVLEEEGGGCSIKATFTGP